MRMSQRINRSQKPKDPLGGQDGGNTGRGGSNDEKDNPIVALEPEENLKQASIDKSKKFTSASKDGGLGMSRAEAPMAPSLF